MTVLPPRGDFSVQSAYPPKKMHPLGLRKNSRGEVVRWTLTAILLVAACSTVRPRSATLFNGTFYANELDSKMLPGQHVPTNYVGVMRDDGVLLSTSQTFIAANGQAIKYVWDGVCNGNPSQVAGAPVGVELSCVRAHNGSLITTLSDAHGYRHVETCALSAHGRRETCSGTALLPDGSKHDFVYVFDQR